MSSSSRTVSSRGSSSSTSSSTTTPTATSSSSSSSRSQTFPLAHPPPKSSPCLRLSSRLLLQIQQITPSSRIIPVLEIHQPSRFGKPVPNGQPKLSARDMVLTQSEPYSHLPASSAGTSASAPTASASASNPTDESHLSQEMVGAIYTDPKRPSGAGVYIPSADLKWEATHTPRGYRFQLKRASASAPRPRTASASTNTSNGDANASDAPASPPRSRGNSASLDIALDWERRARTSSDETTDSPNPSSNAGTNSSSKPDRFVLTIADQPALRRPWLATLTKKGFMVGGWDRAQRAFLAERLGLGLGGDDQVLYTCFLALGVYVARLEGWVV